MNDSGSYVVLGDCSGVFHFPEGLKKKKLYQEMYCNPGIFHKLIFS